MSAFLCGKAIKPENPCYIKLANTLFFLTEPLDNHGWEWRCYMRDPDDYLIEVGQYTQLALNYFKESAGYVRSDLI